MFQVRPRALVTGLASFAPGLRALVCRGTGGTSSARYCYSVWLRHLVLASRHGVQPPIRSLAEVGPGESLGIGLAAMLSGTDTYVALDAKRHIAIERNLAVLDELISLFGRRAIIPDDSEFPEVHPKLPKYDFPGDVLSDQLLAESLRAERLNQLRSCLMEMDSRSGAREPLRLFYVAPWDSQLAFPAEPVDMVVSQAVMEHVEDIKEAYGSLAHYMKQGGFMSHNIDFRSHGLTRDWNGHWSLGNRTWRIVKGTRPYLINRLPHSAHVAAVEEAGFNIVGDLRREGPPLPRDKLASSFRHLRDDDLRITGCLIQAVKR